MGNDELRKISLFGIHQELIGHSCHFLKLLVSNDIGGRSESVLVMSEG